MERQQNSLKTPRIKKKNVTLRLDPGVLISLQDEAQRRGCTVGDLVSGVERPSSPSMTPLLPLHQIGTSITRAIAEIAGGQLDAATAALRECQKLIAKTMLAARPAYESEMDETAPLTSDAWNG